jgi:hypothetical protein
METHVAGLLLLDEEEKKVKQEKHSKKLKPIRIASK